LEAKETAEALLLYGLQPFYYSPSVKCGIIHGKENNAIEKTSFQKIDI
jgi:hypothetical protein